MIRLRLLLILASVGALLTGTSVFACVAPSPDTEATPNPTSSGAALRMLEGAAQLARTRSWSGTQSVVSTRGGHPRYAVVRVQHTPGSGSRMTVLSTVSVAGTSVSPDLLDDKLFALLANHYSVCLVGSTVTNGRPSVLVEARRPGQTGVDAIAGRFWVDRATGLVLRRDVFDDNGLVVQSSSMTDLQVEPAAYSGLESVPSAAATASGTHLSDDALAELIDEGWPIVDHLPDDLALFDAVQLGSGTKEVLQLSYSDGLSTMSLFLQKGALPSKTGGAVREISGAQVHVSGSSPEQLAWAGGGYTWTLVSDASDDAIGMAVLVLPHADPPAKKDGMAERVWRGMSRVGAWLNPFN